MRKGSGIGHRHSHLSKEVRKRGVWALEDGGDSARRAWWMRRGEKREEEGRERARPNEGEMCQSSLLLFSISGPVFPHGPPCRSLASLPAVRYQARSRAHSYVSLSSSLPPPCFPFQNSIQHPDDAIIKIKVLPWFALIIHSFYDTIPFPVLRLVR